MTSSWLSPIQWSFLAAFSLMLFASTLSGCGSEKYESRLQNTVEYYKYLERVQKALAPGSFSEGGLTFQPPKGWELIPKQKSEDPRDNRLPDFLRGELPGVVGVWKMNVNVHNGDQTTTKDAYLIALSNAQRWAESRIPGAPSPITYHNDLFFNLMGELGIPDLSRADKGPNLDLNVWKGNVEFPDNPKDAKFAEKKAYNIITLFNPDMRFDNTSMEFTLYQYGSGDHQAALLLITPRNMSTSDNIRENLKMALPTFSYTRPAGGAPASASESSAPPRSGGGSF